MFWDVTESAFRIRPNEVDPHGSLCVIHILVICTNMGNQITFRSTGVIKIQLFSPRGKNIRKVTHFEFELNVFHFVVANLKIEASVVFHLDTEPSLKGLKGHHSHLATIIHATAKFLPCNVLEHVANECCEAHSVPLIRDMGINHLLAQRGLEKMHDIVQRCIYTATRGRDNIPAFVSSIVLGKHTWMCQRLVNMMAH
jgi:hypothetical protein